MAVRTQHNKGAGQVALAGTRYLSALSEVATVSLPLVVSRPNQATTADLDLEGCANV